MVIKPALPIGGLTPLDPDGNGYASVSPTGYINNDYEHTETELPFVTLVRPDPPNDPVIGPSGMFNDIVGTDLSGENAIFTYMDDNYLYFRFRLDGYAPNSKTYSILVDTDGLFGFSGPNADLNATTGNPGFELEISLHTNFYVSVYNIDGTATQPVLISNAFDYDHYCQKSIAITQNSSNSDYFYDFFVPRTILPTIDENTKWRFVGLATMNPNSAISSNAQSDVGGTDTFTNLDDAFIELIDEQSPTPPGEEVLPRSECPTISGPISNGATTVSGSSNGEADGTIITLYINDAVYTNDTVVGGAWSIIVNPELSAGSTVYATALAPGKGISPLNCNLLLVGSSCTDPPTFDQIVPGSKGVIVDINGPAGTIVTVYGPDSDEEMVLYKNGVPSDNNPYTTVTNNEQDVTIKGATGQAMENGTYYATARDVVNSKCQSAKTYFCIGTASSTTPSVDAVQSLSTMVTGTNGVLGATMFVFAGGELIGSKILTATGSWSVPVPSNLICNTSIIAQQLAPGYCISALSAAVSVGYGTASSPVISIDTCVTSTYTVSGYSNESAGVEIEIYVGGSLWGSTVVDASGNWTHTSTTAISTNQAITARARKLTECKDWSAYSASVTLRGTTALSGTFSIVSTVYEGQTSVPVTVSGTSGTYTLSLYIDEGGNLDKIGSATFSANGVVNVSLSPDPYALYAGATLKISLKQGLQCEVLDPNPLAVVICNPPVFTGITITPVVTDKCISTSGTITLTNSESMVIYTPVDNLGADKGYSTLGNGGTIALNTFPFESGGIVTLYVKAERIVSSGNCSATSSESVSFNAFSNPVITTHPESHTVCSGSSTSLTAVWSGTGPNYNVQWQYNNGGGFINLSNTSVYSQTSAWATTATTATLIINNSAGLDGISYRCVVTDLGVPADCQISSSNSATLTVKLLTISDIVVTNSTLGNNGAIDISVSGGDTPYLYDWQYLGSTYSTSEDLTGIPGGDFTITLTDNNGCTRQQTITVGGIGSINLALNSKTDISCYGDNNGTFTVTASAGTSPYVYSIDNFATQQTNNGTFSFLLPGIYTVKAKDSATPTPAESNSVTVTIIEPLEMVVYATISNPSVLLNDGAINVILVGGTTPVAYTLYRTGTPDQLISTLSNSSSRTLSFTGLIAGTYYVNVTDNNSCTASKTGIVLTAPDIVSENCSYTASHSFNTPNNTYSGYDGTYNYFSGPWTEPGSYAQIAINNQALAFGQIPSSSNSSISWTTEQTVYREIDLFGATNIVLSYKLETSQPDKKDDYTVSLYVNNSLVASYPITNGNEYTTQTTITHNSGITYNTTSGNSTNTFEFRISAGSAQSNLRIDDFTLSYNKNLSIGSTTSPATCNNGAINLSVTGGYSPYTYDWDTDGTGDYNDTQDQSGLSASTYHVMVKDSRTCSSASIPVSVSSSPLSASLTGSNPTCAGGGTDGSVTASITATGGGGPFTFKLIKGVSDTVSTITTASSGRTFYGLSAGIYSVKIWQGDLICTTQTAAVELVMPTLSATITPGHNSGNIGTAVSLTASSTAGTITWYDSEYGGTPIETGNNFTTPILYATTNYWVDATQNVCTTSPRVMVTATISGFLFTTQPSNESVCPGGDVTFIVATNPAASSYQWQINTGSGWNNLDGKTNTTLTLSAVATEMDKYEYRCQVSDGSVTAFSNFAILTVNPLPDNSFTLSDPVLCTGATTATITISGSEIDVEYQLRSDSDNSPVGGPIPGTGSSISFTVDPAPVSNTSYNVLATHTITGCAAELTDRSTVSFSDPEVVLTVNESSKCPDLDPALGFEPNNYGPYDPGSSAIGFTITRNSPAGQGWAFSYYLVLTGSTLDGDLVQPAQGSVTVPVPVSVASANDTYELVFYVNNQPGTTITAQLFLVDVSAGGCPEANHSVIQEVSQMPVIGNFE